MKKYKHNILSEEIQEIKTDTSLKAKVNREISKETMAGIISARNTKILNIMAETYEPYNIANALSKLSQEDLLFFFKSVDSDVSAPVFAELDQDLKETVVEAFTSNQIHDIVNELQLDDLVDFVDELPSNLVSKVLLATKKEERDRVNFLLDFKEDTAGRIMTPEFLYVEENNTIKDILNIIKKEGQNKESVWKIFVIDKTRKLVGTITLDRILMSDEDTIISEVMDTDFVYVKTSAAIEEVVKTIKKYDVSVLPVTNSQKRILGIITFDDVIDVIQEQNTQDIQQFAQTIPNISTPYLKRSIFNLVKSYSVWLIILLILDTFIAVALSYLDEPLQIIPLLIAFLTPLMASNSNAADQSSSVIIRELALGNITPKDYFKVAFKEFKTSIYTGLMVAIFLFPWVLIELYTGIVSVTSSDMFIISTFYKNNRDLFFLSIAGLNALSAFMAIIIAKFLGISIPIIAKKIKLDPAIMSQPVISTILDIVSIVIYLAFAHLIMLGL